MKKILVLLAAVMLMHIANAQNIITFRIKDSAANQPLSGVSVSVQSVTKGAISNKNGVAVLNNIPGGSQTIIFSFTGYQTLYKKLNVPLANKDTMQVVMSENETQLSDIIVQSTRTSRTIGNTPTRIETIDGEELDEKNNMRPANVSMLLHESTGMQVQQTSATSGNASIRIQGLDGRYTQLLKDEYPNFGNFASGLSILEIPPLDLKQVEIIKGPASTLYGGGAIAGVVNFISKTPEDKFEGDLLFNQSHVGQTNIGTYFSQKKNKWGYTFLGLLNFQKPYDVDEDGFTELPRNNNFTINPRLFYYPDNTTTIMLGNSYINSNIKGGDVQVIKDEADLNHTYFEYNNAVRNITTLEVDKSFKNKNRFKLKHSLSVFNRHISVPGYNFSGVNTNSFTDASYVSFTQKHTIIGGLNFIYDKFKEKNSSALNASSATTGLYAQDTWDISDKIKMESGLRFDNANYKNVNYKKSQSLILPRISLLFRWTNNLSSRIGGGLGYKIPTVFTEQTESLQYKNVLPLKNVTAEKSVGGTADINYAASSGDFSFSINQMFFLTKIIKPLVPETDTAGNYFFINESKPVISKGFETNLKLIYRKDLKLFAGYTFTHAKAKYSSVNQFLPLLPKNKLNLTLMYEKEDNFKLGLESYFTGHQYLYDGTQTPSFWEFGFSAQKTFNKISLFINFENFTDQRQSKYEPVVNPPHDNPTFNDIWNHTEGFVVNGGVKIKL